MISGTTRLTSEKHKLQFRWLYFVGGIFSHSLSHSLWHYLTCRSRTRTTSLPDSIRIFNKIHLMLPGKMWTDVLLGKFGRECRCRPWNCHHIIAFRFFGVLVVSSISRCSPRRLFVQFMASVEYDTFFSICISFIMITFHLPCMHLNVIQLTLSIYCHKLILRFDDLWWTF